MGLSWFLQLFSIIMRCVSEVRFGLLQSHKESQILAINFIALLVELVCEWAIFALLDKFDMDQAVLIDWDVAFAFWSYFL